MAMKEHEARHKDPEGGARHAFLPATIVRRHRPAHQRGQGVGRAHGGLLLPVGIHCSWAADWRCSALKGRILMARDWQIGIMRRGQSLHPEVSMRARQSRFSP